ncbi:MAG: alpha/beta hydrolase [Schumannella sp.]|nr:alpha/beta hydrolase [Schumannella sp.]
MFDHHSEPEGEPRDEAERLDRALPDVDWTLPAPGSVASRFSAPSGELAVVSLGNPLHPRILLVPGVSGSKEDFLLLAPVLAAAGYYVQSYDLAGQYESADAGPGRGRRYDYAMFRDDMVAVLEDGGPAHLLGYSFAGIVAQLVTVERPDLVRSLTLLATPPEPGNSFRGVRGLGPFTWMATGRVGAALMTWGIVTNKNHVPPMRLEFVRARFALTSRRSMEDIIVLMKHAPDVRSRLAALDIPKLVAVGSHDLWPAALHAGFAARIDAELAVYPTGHSPCETTPHQLARDMVSLFAKVAAV